MLDRSREPPLRELLYRGRKELISGTKWEIPLWIPAPRMYSGGLRLRGGPRACVMACVRCRRVPTIDAHHHGVGRVNTRGSYAAPASSFLNYSLHASSRLIYLSERVTEHGTALTLADMTTSLAHWLHDAWLRGTRREHGKAREARVMRALRTLANVRMARSSSSSPRACSICCISSSHARAPTSEPLRRPPETMRCSCTCCSGPMPVGPCAPVARLAMRTKTVCCEEGQGDTCGCATLGATHRTLATRHTRKPDVACCSSPLPEGAPGARLPPTHTGCGGVAAHGSAQQCTQPVSKVSDTDLGHSEQS